MCGRSNKEVKNDQTLNKLPLQADTVQYYWYCNTLVLVILVQYTNAANDQQ